MQREIDTGREAEKWGWGEKETEKKRHAEKREKERLIDRERREGDRAPYRDQVRDRAGR